MAVVTWWWPKLLPHASVPQFAHNSKCDLDDAPVWLHSFQSVFGVGKGYLGPSVWGLCLSLSLMWKETCLFSLFLEKTLFTAFIVFALSFWTLVIYVYVFTSAPPVLSPTFSTDFPWMALFLHNILFLALKLFACVYRESRYVCKWSCLCHGNMIFKGLDYITLLHSLHKMFVLVSCCQQSAARAQSC